MNTNTISDQIIIRQTQAWVRKVVIGLNFCPFAAREVQRGSIHYEVVRCWDLHACLDRVLRECQRLDTHPEIETTLIILPEAFQVFETFLDMLDTADGVLYENGYEGIYQVASFHPDYRFAGTDNSDPTNYTNRSPYPMLHLLREASLEKTLEHYPNPEEIPERNIRTARQRGLAHLELLRDSCFSEEI